MDRDEAKQIAMEAVDAAFARIGIIEAEDALELRKDLAHLRSWRVANERVKEWTFKAIITAAVTGFVAWLLSTYLK
jgi:hypothetical protein